jgi:nitrate/nitrite transporter NarK
VFAGGDDDMPAFGALSSALSSSLSSTFQMAAGAASGQMRVQATAATLARLHGGLASDTALEQVAGDMVQSVEMVRHQGGALDWDFTM